MKWLKRVGQFTFEMCKTWGALVTGGFLIALFASWQLTGHSIPVKVGWAIIISAVVIAAFQVWNRQFDRAEELARERHNGGLTIAEPTPREIIAQTGTSRLDESEFPTEPAAEPEPKVPIEVVSIRPTFVNNGGYCTWEEADHGFIALIVSFKNQIATKPGGENRSFPNVTANLTFKGTDKVETIDYGTWLNQYTRYVPFKPGEVRHLLVVMFERASKQLVGFYNPNTINPFTRRWSSRMRLREPEHRDLPLPPCEVTLHLISENTTLFTGRYILTASEDGTLELKKQEALNV
jgi:hypothetical protein